MRDGRAPLVRAPARPPRQLGGAAWKRLGLGARGASRTRSGNKAGSAGWVRPGARPLGELTGAMGPAGPG